MKFSPNAFFKERVSAYYNEVRKYTRYMFNDHLLFVLVFALGALLYYYSNWVKTIDHSFPAPLIMAVVFTAALLWSPVYTYIKRPDTVYLLPLEEEMKPYFEKTVWASFFAQSYLLIVLLAFMMPMYAASQQTGFGNFFMFLGAVLAAKLWHLFCRLKALNLPSNQKQNADIAIRLLLSFVFLFAVFEAKYIIAGFSLLIMAFWFFYIKKEGSRPLKWDLLAELEEKRLASFYQVANLFTDVPHLRGTAKRRAWLDGMLPGPQSGSHVYLLFRTFVRMNEYFGLYVRLTIIAAVIILVSGLLPVQLIVAALFLYLTGFQLLPIVARHDHIIWPKLYPEGNKEKQKAVQQLLMRIMILQSFVFGAMAAVNGVIIGAAIVVGTSIVVTLLFVNTYVPLRLKKMERV